MDENSAPDSSLRSELELVTEEQLSQHLKICKRQLYNMRMRGEIPYLKLGRVVRYRVGEVVAALEERSAEWATPRRVKYTPAKIGPR